MNALSLIIDGILVLIVATSVINGRKRGFFKMIFYKKHNLFLNLFGKNLGSV